VYRLGCLPLQQDLAEMTPTCCVASNAANTTSGTQIPEVLL
jgi:hypothetical protein